MSNFNDVTSGNIKKHNLTWPQILDHADKILIIGGFGSEKTNLLFNLIILKILIYILKIHVKENIDF